MRVDQAGFPTRLVVGEGEEEPEEMEDGGAAGTSGDLPPRVKAGLLKIQGLAGQMVKVTSKVLKGEASVAAGAEALGELELDVSQIVSPVKDLPVIMPGEPTTSKCTVCDKTLSSTYRAKMHYKSQHLKVSQFVCAKCGHCFFSHQALSVHSGSMHVPKKDMVYSCKWCIKQGKGGGSYRRREMQAHVKKHPRYKEWVAKKLLCDHCLNAFPSKDIRAHERSCKYRTTMVEPELFACRNEGCGSVFNQKKRRNWHEKHACKKRV